MSTCRPNYCIGFGNYSADSVYLTLEENNSVDFYSRAPCSGLSADVFNGLILTWSIDEGLTDIEIDHLEERVAPYMKIIVENSTIEFRDNFFRKLNDTANKAVEAISNICREHFTTDTDHCGDETCKYCLHETNNDNREKICGYCDGSGEGMIDGTICGQCDGVGTC